MNAQRRKSLAKATALVAEARSLLEDILSEEQDAYDNMPESLQDSERGERAQTAIDAIESAMSDLESAESSIEDASE